MTKQAKCRAILETKMDSINGSNVTIIANRRLTVSKFVKILSLPLCNQCICNFQNSSKLIFFNNYVIIDATAVRYQRH